MRPVEVSQRKGPKAPASADHYTLKVRKRDLHALAVLGVLWFAWSEGAEVARLFGNLIDVLK